MARATARVVTDLEYSAMEEFGGIIDAPTMGGPAQVLYDRETDTFFGPTVYHPAQPYMRPAFAAGKDDAVKAVADVIRAAIA